MLVVHQVHLQVVVLVEALALLEQMVLVEQVLVHRQGRKCEVVGEEDQPLAGLRILEADTPQRGLEAFEQ